MAIKTRRGNYLDFDPNKLVAGELAMILNHGTPTGELYFCFSPGNKVSSRRIQLTDSPHALRITINS